MLANSCWQNSNWCVWTKQQHVGKLLARNRPCLYSHQQFANMLLSRSHTPILVGQQGLANISLTCEGHLRPGSNVKLHFRRTKLQCRSTQIHSSWTVGSNIEPHSFKWSVEPNSGQRTSKKTKFVTFDS